jgi:hypothetical protein
MGRSRHDDERWFEQALMKAGRTDITVPRVFLYVEWEATTHRRLHGAADGLRWCARCQAFMSEDDNPYTHPHCSGGYDHSSRCALCLVFDMFRCRSRNHLEEHTKALGWYQCSVCPGYYPPDSDEDDHDAHAWGVFDPNCELCQAWERQAELVLDTVTVLSAPQEASIEQ